MQRIAWRDNGLVIAAIGAGILLTLVIVESLLLNIHYQEPVLFVDIQGATEEDGDESDEVAALSAADELTARTIVTRLMAKPDGDYSWSGIQQQFPQVSEAVWIEVAMGANKRRYLHSAEQIFAGLLANNQGSVDVQFQYAKLASDNDDDKLAVTRYQHLLQIHPNHQASLINLGLLLARLNQHTEAVNILSRAIDTTSGSRKAKALSIRASSYMNLGDYPQALTDFQTSIQFRPNHASTWRKLANALLSSGADDAVVLQAFDKAASLQTNYLQALHERGQFHWLRGDFNNARRDLEQVSAIAPDYQPVRWTLLHLYIAIDKRRSAKNTFKWLRKQSLSSEETLFLNGLENFLGQDFDQALRYFVKLRDDPEAHWHNYYRAVCAIRLTGETAIEPMALLQNVAASPWHRSQAQLAMADWYIQQQDFDDGLTILQSLSDRHSHSHYYAYQLGKAYLDADYYLQAASALQRATSLDPDDSQSRLSLAVAYRRGEQTELALKTYQDLLVQEPDHRTGRYNYAWLLERLDRDAEAVEQLQQLLVIEPGHVSAQILLAELYRDQNRFAEAISLLNDVLTEEPVNHDARELLAEVQYQNQALEPALEEVNRLLVLSAGRVSAQMLKSDILSELGQLQAAADTLLAIPAPKANRNTVIKLFNVGVRALRDDQLQLAEVCNRAAIEIDPDYDKAWVNLSSALNRAERFEETVTLLESRPDLLSQNVKLVTNLAGAYQLMGNYRQVIALLEPLQQQNNLSEEGKVVLADSYSAL